MVNPILAGLKMQSCIDEASSLEMWLTVSFFVKNLKLLELLPLHMYKDLDQSTVIYVSP